MIRLCIFDLDGTLADTLGSIAGFANQALRRCGWGEIPLEEYRYLVGNGADQLMRGMLKRAAGGFSEQDVARLRAVYDALYEADPLRDVTPYPGMLQTLQQLQRQGCGLAVLSNKPDNVTQAVVGGMFPPGLFARCWGQREGVPRKPSPEGALRIAQELAVSPAECLYIGDTCVDMQTGNSAGMRTVGVLWGFRDGKELEENHAWRIAAAPEEILRFAAGEEEE